MNTSSVDNLRKATWLELFYDLAYVAVIAKIVHHLPEYVDKPGSYFAALLIFIPIWWNWVGHTYLANRFDRNDALQTSLVLLQLFFIILLIAAINPFFEHETELFVWGYFAARAMLIVMYVREYALNADYRPLLIRISIGFGLGAAVWLASLLFHGKVQYLLWAASIAIDIATLFYCRDDLKHTAKIHHEHLAERTGLFTIIMFGEMVVALVAYIEGAHVSVSSLTLATSGFLIISLMWWLYFYVSEPFIEDNPILESQLHGYSNLFVFFSIILFSTAIVSWEKSEPLIVMSLTALSLTLFSETMQIILGKNKIYAGHTLVNISRHCYSFAPLVLAYFAYQNEYSIVFFNFVLVLWLLGYAITNNFTRHLK